ncbi:MAG: hypothetical protein AAGL97_09620 [Pseudomonadota bacterium]
MKTLSLARNPSIKLSAALLSALLICSCAAIGDDKSASFSASDFNSCGTNEITIYQPTIKAGGASRILRIDNGACIADLKRVDSDVCGPISPSYFAVLSEEAKLQLGDRAFRLKAFPYPPQVGQEIFENQISPRFVMSRFKSDELICWANIGDQVASYIVAEEILERAFLSENMRDKSEDLLLAKQHLQVATESHPSNCTIQPTECDASVTMIFPFGIPDAHHQLVELSGEFGLSASEAREHLELAVRGGSLRAYEMLTGITFIHPIR